MHYFKIYVIDPEITKIKNVIYFYFIDDKLFVTVS